MSQGFSAAYHDRGLGRGHYTAWTLSSGAELMRAVNPSIGWARARHDMALALHLCLGRTPGRITRHVGDVRELPPPRVGLMTLSPGATDLEYEAEGGTRMLTLSLPAVTFTAVDGRAEDAFLRGLLPFRDDALRSVLLELAERAAQGVSERLYIDHAIAFLAASLAAPRRLGARRALGEIQLKRVLEAIEAALDRNPSSPPSLDSLAATAGLSLSEFTRGFHAAMGESPHAHLTRSRIARAQALMRAQPHLPLADLAVMLGFADQAHFSRRFRHVTGTTPARFRRGTR
ncbi:helix-turn-helix transcriptional regulator [Roseococcus pinisoli]|uniref:Helix-turn-helix transcriptional regulator n=1 Tax=Roseococcus pinisoli TaxID=2835040 RepID=A0ABS5QA37_9PROT|nr:AraC family transcriptional regulator [Roseococcus pinisoli]MBS7810293.1 helix-turn-helix transcriptional regulator [Roseococcus pinisoli]